MTKRQKYGIRKYKIGAASIALGTVIVVGMSEDNEAQASEISGDENVALHSNISNGESSNENTLENNTTTDKYNEDTNLNPENVDNNKGLTAEVEAISNKEVIKSAALVSEENKPNVVEAPTSQPNINTNNQLSAGNDVSEKVTVEEASITGKDGSVVINPHEAERVTLNYKLKFDENIKENDYFDIKISDNVDTKGISTKRKTPDIVTENNSEIIANGIVLDNGDLRYTFTKYVIDKTNINANLSLNLFFKPSHVLNDGKVIVKEKLGKHTSEHKFNVVYLDGVKDGYGKNLVLNGRIDTLNKDQGRFTHYAYVNPHRSNLYRATVYGTFAKGQPNVGTKPKVTVYKYTGTNPLPRSVYINENSNDLENVTDKVRLYVYDNGNYSATIDNDSNDVYIIKYEGYYDNTTPNLTYRTQLQSYLDYYGYRHNTLTWDNGVQFYSNNASGSGKDKPNEPIYEKSKEIELDYNTYTSIIKQAKDPVDVIYEYSKPIYTESHLETISGNGEYVYTDETEDTRPVEIVEDTVHGSNHATGVIEFEEDTNPGGGAMHHTSNIVEFDEDTATGIITGAISDHTTVEDTMEYSTESNLIKLEYDNTLPPNISGQAEGTIEEIEENSVIDINDFTMIEGDHGEANGVVEEIEENNYIDINDFTMTEGSQGQAEGIVEEIEDNHHLDIIEITTPIGENGEIQGIIEEVEDSNLLEFYEETGNGEISGHATGTIEEIEDNHHVNTWFELGTENGSNSSETFEEDTEGDKPSVETGAHDPIEIVEDTITQESGHNEGVIVDEEDTKPPHFAPPTAPKEEEPQEPNQPKENSPKLEEKVVPNSPKKQEKTTPKIKSEKPSNPTLVSNKPNFKPVNSITIKTSSDMTVGHNPKQQVQQKELPNTGKNTDKNPLLLGGLISFIGLALLRRNKKINIDK